MDQPQRAVRAHHNHHPARHAVFELFNLYLGRNVRHSSDDAIRESPNKMQKRITAFKQLPPRNEQFISDFEQLRIQFPDHELLRGVTETVIVAQAVQCCSHAPQADFIIFSLKTLSAIGFVYWDSFLPSLLSAISAAEASASQIMQAGATVVPPSITISTSPAFQTTNPASPLPSIHGIGSPAQSATETVTSIKSLDISSNGLQSVSKLGNVSTRALTISYLRQLTCKIIMVGLESNLKPSTHAEIFANVLGWLVSWGQAQGNDEADRLKGGTAVRTLREWVRYCLDVMWAMVDEDKCRVPFYELIRSGLQFMEIIPDDEALFTIILEIHRRRDMVAMHMQMLDQHLQCPTFGTHRFLSHTFSISPGESSLPARYSPITYPSVLGEPLHGEDIANSIRKGSLDWERALRCLKHALRSTPSPDWWRRVLIVAPCYRPQQALHATNPGAVFSSEMICEATIDRTLELLKLANSEINCWQEWLIYGDIFFFLMKSGCIDFLDFVEKLVTRVSDGDSPVLRSNHLTWLLSQIIRLEIVMNALNSDPKKVETTRKILSFHKEDRHSESSNPSPQNILLDFISSSQTLRIWSFNASIREFVNPEQLQKGKQIDEWWKLVSKGDRMIDFMTMDDRSMGMFWVLSYTMAQPACEAIMAWLTSAGVTELLQVSNLQPSERFMVMQETCPLPMSILSGLSINLCLKLAYQMEDSLFLGQVTPSMAMVETYVRLLIVAPHSLFRPHFTTLTQRSASIMSKSGVSLLLLEILNYRLLPLYRYHGKSKALMYDVTKLVSMLKIKRGDHRVFRLAENLCMNLILSIRDFFLVKKELKGPTEFTETLNRITIISLAITIKTRGIAEVEQMAFLQPLLEQIMATSQHTWSEKTLRHFPPLIRDALMGRKDKRGQSIQAWQQAETTVINQCTQILSPTADPSYVMTYISHSFPEHRQYLCAGAWMLMNGHPESINSGNLGRVLREFPPEEVTSNIYTMVDVLLHQIQVEMQRGQGGTQDLIGKATVNLSSLIWTHELFPLDILLLALNDRDDDPHALPIVINLLERPELQQKIKMFRVNRGPVEHWLHPGPFKRVELQKALGNHLSWKDRNPPFFDDNVARLLPVVPLILYRMIENDFTDRAEKLLIFYSQFLAYHPLRFTFVRDILAYFYGLLPSKLIVRILSVLDIPKIPFSESFPQHVSSSNPAVCPPPDYFANLLLRLVNNVIPFLNSKSKTDLADSLSNSFVRASLNKVQSPQFSSTNATEGLRAFYQNQDPGTYVQLILETVVIEILSLPIVAAQTVSSFVQIVVHLQPTLIQSSSGSQGLQSGAGQTVLPTSPSGASSDSLGTSRSGPKSAVINVSNFVSTSGYTCQQLPSLIIQACGLLLSQLPSDFHVQLYLEASRVIKACWWITDGKRSARELDSAVGYSLLDPSWAAQDNTSTAIGNVVALLHAFCSNLPQEWLEGTHTIINHLRPVTSVAMLRVAFRIISPLLSRFAMSHNLFMKTIVLLFSILTDVFGRNSQTSSPCEASEITDIIDFLYHAIMYEGQGGPVQSGSKPKPDTLAYCSKMLEQLRPDVQHLLSHLHVDQNRSIYAATHQKLV